MGSEPYASRYGAGNWTFQQADFRLFCHFMTVRPQGLAVVLLSAKFPSRRMKMTAMSIAEQIDKDYIQAYKAKDQVKLGTLRLLKTAAKNRQVELMRPLEDDDYMDVLLREVKQRQDSIEQYNAAGRADLADKEAAEAAVLQSYLPAQLSDEELAEVVEKTVAPLLEGGMKNMGRAISAIMAEYKGRVDGKAVSAAVKARLQQAR